MSFGEPNSPYGQPPQGQQPPGQQPGYGIPGQAQGQPGYGYPQAPPVQPGAYGYPQGAPGTIQGNNGFINLPGLGSVEVASMGRRFSARLIDGALIGIVYGILIAVGASSIFGAAKSASDACDSTSPTYQQCLNDHLSSSSGGIVAGFFAVFALVGLITLLYEWLLVSLVGATLGKMLVGLRVVKESTGGKPGLGGGFIRWIIPEVGAFVCGIGALLVYLSPFFDSSGKRQGWHDRAAGTIVVKLAR
jgi:uncharacterized RDD family membrane protein YckC